MLIIRKDMSSGFYYQQILFEANQSKLKLNEDLCGKVFCRSFLEGLLVFQPQVNNFPISFANSTLV